MVTEKDLYLKAGSDRCTTAHRSAVACEDVADPDCLVTPDEEPTDPADDWNVIAQFPINIKFEFGAINDANFPTNPRSQDDQSGAGGRKEFWIPKPENSLNLGLATTDFHLKFSPFYEAENFRYSKGLLTIEDQEVLYFYFDGLIIT